MATADEGKTDPSATVSVLQTATHSALRSINYGAKLGTIIDPKSSKGYRSAELKVHCSYVGM